MFLDRSCAFDHASNWKRESRRLCELEKFACKYAPALRFIKFIWTNSTTAKRHFEPRPRIGERQLDVEFSASQIKFACKYAPALRFIKFIWTNSTTAKRHFEPRPRIGERQLDVEFSASQRRKKKDPLFVTPELRK
jgi:hypothetical protein